MHIDGHHACMVLLLLHHWLFESVLVESMRNIASWSCCALTCFNLEGCNLLIGCGKGLLSTRTIQLSLLGVQCQR
jgi:hypothetical protein